MTLSTARGNLSFSRAACIECGVCTGACDLLGRARLTIGEVASRALAGETSGEAVDAILRCSLCGLCCADCPEGIEARPTMVAARELLGVAGALPVTYRGMFDGCDFGIFGEYKRVHGIAFDDLDRPGTGTVFFPGCALSAYAPEIVRRAHGWLTGQGIEAGLVDSCCGAGLYAGGMVESGDVLHARLSSELQQRNAERLITVCPECYGALAGTLDGVEVVRLSSLLAEAGVRAPGGGHLTVHDSCSDRASGAIGAAVREMLAGYSLVEMEHSGSHTMCCGSGGLVSCVDPDLSRARAQTRVDEFHASGADLMVTACVNCSHRLGAAAQGDVLHYLELVFGTRIDWIDVDAKLARLFDTDTPPTISGAAARGGAETAGVDPAGVETARAEASAR